MVSTNGAGTNDLLTKLNRLEDKVAKLTAQIKTNKQTISELKFAISQRDAQIHELELKLGYAQQSLLEKAMNKIEQCRAQIKTGIDEEVIHPALTQIQRHLKTAQEFVDEAKEILREKKALVDNRILIAKDKAVQCPEQAKLYVEQSLIEPAQAVYNQTLETIGMQIKAARNLVENKAIHPGKVVYDEIVAKAQILPGKLWDRLQAQVIEPATHASEKASLVVRNIYPGTLAYLGKSTDLMNGMFRQAINEITDQIKKSPFWDGKNNLKASY